MSLPVLVLRPEPGNAATCARLRDAGCDARALPLFALETVDWDAPDPAHYDALLLTSAAAARLAGSGLTALARLPVHAVGAATADAARAAGLAVATIGTGGAAALLAGLDAPQRLLWLAGAERTAIDPPAGISIDALTVYRARPLAVAPVTGPAIAMVHSAAAARQLAALASEPAAIHIVAISAAAAAAAGSGWGGLSIATRPDDAEMVALAAKLCHDTADTGAQAGKYGGTA